MRIAGEEVGFWLVVGLVAIASVAVVKVIAAQSFAPPGLAKLAGHL